MLPSDAAVQAATAALSDFVGNDALSTCVRIVLQHVVDSGELVPRADVDAQVADLQSRVAALTARAVQAEAERDAALA